jgi:phosphoribosylformylglycinamidine (FGAM) synthase-like enzyme
MIDLFYITGCQTDLVAIGAVAIGELAAGLEIDLDKVPKKYAGLDGTEIAISESQERMAVVVDPKDAEAFLDYAAEENLEAVTVAVVTENPRLKMSWRGKTIVDISRAFLDTNGAHQEASVVLHTPEKDGNPFPAFFNSGVMMSFSLATSTAKETSVGGTLISP